MSGVASVRSPALVFSTDPLFYIVGTIAVVIVGLGKGGFSGLGLLSTPLLALVLPPIQAAAVMMPILVVQDVLSVWVYRKTFDRRNSLILITGGLIGVAAGWVLATYVGLEAVGVDLPGSHWDGIVIGMAAGLAVGLHAPVMAAVVVAEMCGQIALVPLTAAAAYVAHRIVLAVDRVEESHDIVVPAEVHAEDA